MGSRIASLIDWVRASGLAPVTCFGPQTRAGLYPFAGGGTCTPDERQRVLDAFLSAAPLTHDPERAARNRALRAAARH
ncbi:hypothetical protein OE699_12825 [Sedimentimonas flavescens]|uniref:Uncharacterized protein n=1 Tax=Sedimentimonas flavescens TaxID=2851012 RepID=A0ABT3A163_9RHOB|nr:hypothetical protein [Sedimentimonas flavescens]MCV2879731.1 hypothetical protein [Sedimentimonas flavescens]